MWIDLRYPIVLGAFYTPGLAMLIGAWMLGYSTAEAREFVAVMGAGFGICASICATVGLFVEGKPLWWRVNIGGGE